eukprot:scaffold11629_cov131-Isochrysis_galbana.AAC.6
MPGQLLRQQHNTALHLRRISVVAYSICWHDTNGTSRTRDDRVEMMPRGRLPPGPDRDRPGTRRTCAAGPAPSRRCAPPRAPPLAAWPATAGWRAPTPGRTQAC